MVTFFFSLSGLLPPGTQFDLFRGTAAMKQDVDDLYPTTLSHTIKASNLYVAIYHFDTLFSILYWFRVQGS